MQETILFVGKDINSIFTVRRVVCYNEQMVSAIKIIFTSGNL